MQTQHAPVADPTAIVGRRSVAFLIDLAIGIAILTTTFALLAESTEFPSSFAAQEICEIINDSGGGNVCINSGTTVILAEGGDLAALFWVGLIYGVGTQLLLPALTGFSLGKLMLGLRVVDKNTFAKAGFGAHILRWLMWIVDWAPYFCVVPLVGLITGLSTKGHRRVGDMVANTFVVDKSMVDQPVAIEGANDLVPTVFAPPPPTAAPTAPPLPTRPAATPPPPSGAPIVPTTPAPPTGAPIVPTVDPAPPAMDSAPPPDPAPPAVEPAPAPTSASPPPPPTAAPVAAQPGVDAPQWDTARDTYIQWDGELQEWMEWNEASGRWVPISQ